jgi:parallel beta helix pectate lyase-like protein
MTIKSTNQIIRLLIIALCLLLPSFAAAGVITTDTVWQGEVALQDDILVPAGVTLTIRQGTIVRVASAESTKTDPEFLSPLTEITVRGTLKVDGTANAPVLFSAAGEKKAGSWAGIVVDGGTAILKSCRVMHAESALYVVDGIVRLADSELKDNRYGIAALGAKSSMTVTATKITENDYGIFNLKEAKIDIRDCTVRDNRKKDLYAGSFKEYSEQLSYTAGADLPVSRLYGDEVLLGDTIWQGRIEVKGIIRVPEGSRLVVMPGTVVEFRKKDTTGDGIGENGLLIQGLLLAKGSVAAPIIFRSAEKIRRQGDWDAINIMNSDGAQNLLEFCQIEDAYRGLHFHFSSVAVTSSVLRNNYRGIQFQESTVTMRGNWLYGNKSGIQGRDSEVDFSDNFVVNNHLGGNFFRSKLQVRGNRFLGNLKEGLRLREGVTVAEENLIDGNRYGLLVADTFYGSFGRNVITNNAEVGFSMKNADNIEIADNFFGNNGFNGLSIQDVRAVIKGNQIAANGERGIGIISFAGLISGNNLVRNGLYAIELEGKNDVAAPANWWGGADAERVILDRQDDPARGRVSHDGSAPAPLPYAWPLRDILAPATWEGSLVVNGKVEVAKETTLTIMPATKVAFADGAGLTVNGKLVAKGEKTREITFTSLQKKEAGAWDEMLLEHANNSVIAHAIIEYATWGVHSHFTNLSLSDSVFRNNTGGMRFRSGPVTVTRSVFADNEIGIRSYRGNGIFSENVITRNSIGVFVREKGGSLTLSRNDLFANSGYNIRVGDFNDEDVNARENWWGDGDPAESLFDGRKEPGIGMVLYEPFLQKPVSAGQAGGR